MNDFDRKLEKALTLLDRIGIMKSNYLPPLYPMLWRMGLEVPPPHFLSFGNVVLINGLPCGVCWIGFCMISFEAHGLNVSVALLGFAVAVLLPGMAIAAYYASGRRRFHLPKWSDL